MAGWVDDRPASLRQGLENLLDFLAAVPGPLPHCEPSVRPFRAGTGLRRLDPTCPPLTRRAPRYVRVPLSDLDDEADFATMHSASPLVSRMTARLRAVTQLANDAFRQGDAQPRARTQGDVSGSERR